MSQNYFDNYVNGLYQSGTVGGLNLFSPEFKKYRAVTQGLNPNRLDRVLMYDTPDENIRLSKKLFKMSADYKKGKYRNFKNNQKFVNIDNGNVKILNLPKSEYGAITHIINTDIAPDAYIGETVIKYTSKCGYLFKKIDYNEYIYIKRI